MNAKIKLIFCLTALSLAAFGQEKKAIPDSIQIIVGDNLWIGISVSDVSVLSKDTALLEDIVTLQRYLYKSRNTIPTYKYYDIEYYPGKSISMKEAENKKVFLITGDSVTTTKLNCTCRIINFKYKIIIHFSEINDLLNENISGIIRQVVHQLPGKTKNSIVYNFEWKNSTLIHHKELNTKSKSTNALWLDGGIGVEIIKNQLVTDFSYKIAIALGEKGVLKHEFYLSDNILFIFDKENNMKINNFLNVGYKNLSLFGLEVGYLIKRSGDFFEKNTFKAGIVKDIGKHFTISPQFYFYDNFSKVYPGIRLNVSF